MFNGDIYKENIEKAFAEFDAVRDEMNAEISFLDNKFDRGNWDISIAMDQLWDGIKEAEKTLEVLKENVDDVYEMLRREEEDNNWDEYDEGGYGYIDRYGVWREVDG